MFTSEPGMGPIFLSNLMCKGNENSLLECSSLPVGINFCDHKQDVGVECEGSITLLASAMYVLCILIVVIDMQILMSVSVIMEDVNILATTLLVVFSVDVEMDSLLILMDTTALVAKA